MKSEMNVKKIQKNDLRKRLARSVGFGLLFAIILVIGFLSVQEDRSADETAKVLRQSFQRNEKIGRGLFSSSKLSIRRPTPPIGREPRVNGMLGLESKMDFTNYRVKIDQVGKKLEIGMADFYKLPKSEATTDFKCIEGWSEIVNYAGVKFSDFANAYMLGVNTKKENYQFVGFQTPDEKYYVSIDMKSMMHPQTILAYEMNGVPLSLENGYPIRLIIPTKYGIKSLKRIGRIFFSDTQPPDYWAEQGYDWYSGL